MKKIISEAGHLPVEAATCQGKQLAFPVVDADIERGAVLWIREGWREQTGLGVPTTIDELITLATEFNKIAGAGAVGLPIRKEIFGLCTNYTVNGFSYAYGAYPELWVKKDGKLAYGNIQPEMKESLGKLAEIYQAGLIDPEFIVKDETKVDESIVSGKTGIFYGAHWSSLNPIQNNLNLDPNAVWKPYNLPSKDGSPTKVGIEMATNLWFAASSKVLILKQL